MAAAPAGSLIRSGEQLMAAVVALLHDDSDNHLQDGVGCLSKDRQGNACQQRDSCSAARRLRFSQQSTQEEERANGAGEVLEASKVKASVPALP